MYPLENPSWSALTSYQAKWARVEELARRFPPEVCVHGAFAAPTPEAWDCLGRIAGQPVGIFSSQPLELPSGWTVTRKIELYEMVHQAPSSQPPRSFEPGEIVELAADDLPQMAELYSATRPGRALCPRMPELGGFLGIRSEGRVVAMACLRLHFPAYREISTVGTLPGHTGRGYATALVGELVRRIRAAGETPFLTVSTENVRAIDIYQRLGFHIRALLHSTTLRYQ